MGGKYVTNWVRLCQQMKAEKYHVEEVASLNALVSPVIPELGLSHLFIYDITAKKEKKKKGGCLCIQLCHQYSTC